jgi:hypothetical protein
VRRKRLEMYHRSHTVHVELQRFALRLGLEKSKRELTPELSIVRIESGRGFGDVLASDTWDMESGRNRIVPWEEEQAAYDEE